MEEDRLSGIWGAGGPANAQGGQGGDGQICTSFASGDAGDTGLASAKGGDNGNGQSPTVMSITATCTPTPPIPMPPNPVPRQYCGPHTASLPTGPAGPIMVEAGAPPR